jgi:RNA polymerase sigma factor (sigma-70 family)
MNDERLIEGIKLQEESAYSLLYARYYTVIERLVIQNNGTTDDAKDIFQNTLLVLHDKAKEDKLEITSSLKTYVYSVSRNLWLKELRDKRKLYTQLVETFEEPVEEKIIESEDKNSFLQKLSRAFLNMTGHCKMLLVAMFYKKKSIALIAEENGYKNIHTAQNQKYKCLEQARKEFKK